MQPAAAEATTPNTAAVQTFVLPALAAGEVYAGLLLRDGAPLHHVVLLPGDEAMSHDKALAWAKEKGGDLPTRKEQALLFANCAPHFQGDWYWSNETHARAADFAWYQIFGSGYQYGSRSHKSTVFRCRAVRRVAI